MLIISPPFGNYLTFLPYTIPIKGSYTTESRPGLITQIINTLQYSTFHKGWINKINIWGVHKNENFNMPFYQFIINLYWRLI